MCALHQIIFNKWCDIVVNPIQNTPCEIEVLHEYGVISREI